MRTENLGRRGRAWVDGSAAWTSGALVGAALVFRYALDTLAPVLDYTTRAAILSCTIIGVFVIAGGAGAMRMRSVGGGVLTSVLGAGIGGVLSIAGAAALLAVWHDPATLEAWRNSGGLEEAFVDVPLKLVAIGAVMGLAGALVGRVVAAGLWRHSHRRA